ncbi:MAG TPA: M56 family metallopeptidase [Verrucomicrobiae bacterium]|jgi:beta-lactamase regulating signal transducer with metallopeptidase domain|nr:M56 family metallopeptidase [Verrucomicrobiae bacterium]
MNDELQPICDQLLSALGNGLYQSSILAILVWGTIKVWPRSNAASRYVVALSALLLMGLLPVAHLLSGFISRPPEPAFTDRNEAATVVGQQSEEEIGLIASENAPPQSFRDLDSLPAEVEPGGGTTTAHAGLAEKHESQFEGAIATAKTFFHDVTFVLSGRWEVKLPFFISVALVGVWFCVASVRLSLLVWQLVLLRRIKADGRSGSAELCELFHRLCVQLNVTRSPRLMLSPKISAPMAAGFRHPAVVLPAGIQTAQTAGAGVLEPVLRHEMAHIARRDDWANLVQQVIKAVLFFNPAVLWFSRIVTLEREIACDDHVVEGMGFRTPYARFLVEFAGRVQSRDWAAAPAAWSSRTQLKQRIDMILDAKRNSSPRLARTRAGLLAAASILVAAFAFYAGPRLVLAQEEQATEPSVPPTDVAPEQLAGTAITVEEPAGGGASINLNTESRPRKKARGRNSTPPSAEAVLAAPADPALPPAAPMIAHAGIVAPQPMVAPVPRIYAQAGGPPSGDEPAPPRAGRPRRDESIERRLDRLEKMVESLLQQEKGKGRTDFDYNYKFDFKDGKDGNWKSNKLNDEDRARIKDQARREADRAMDQAKQDVEKARDHAKRDAERARRDMEKAMREAEHSGNQEQLAKLKEELAQSSDSVKFSLDAQRKALEAAKNSLEKQLQNLERQMAKLERDRGQMEEMKEHREREEAPEQEERAKVEAKRGKERNKDRVKHRATDDGDDKPDNANPKPEPESAK